MHVRLSQARLFANLMFARNRLAGCLAAALTVLLTRCKDKGYLVRAGSTQHREPPGPRRARAVMAGMQEAQVTWHPPPRPPTAKLHRTGFKSLTRLPRALRALAHEGGVTEDGPHPPVDPGARLVIAGRATSVPFTAVLNGPERTTRDNASAAWTCTVQHLRRC
jgi:hypothetical protein